jgi:hypothetical protein
MTLNAPAPHNIDGHLKILGVCWIVYGFLRLAATLWLASFHTTATLMFGALLGRVPDPFALMADFHFLYLVVEVWSAVAGVIGLLSGLALLANQGAARGLTLFAAFLSLTEIPLGVTLGCYTLIVLLPINPAQLHVHRAPPEALQS